MPGRGRNERLAQVRDSKWDEENKVWLMTIRAQHLGGCNELCSGGYHYLEDSRKNPQPPPPEEPPA